MLVRRPVSQGARVTDAVQRYRDNLRDELNGAALYASLAAAETDPVREDLLQRFGPRYVLPPGLPKEDAQHAAAQIMRDKRGALDTLARKS
jgi:hypothetical protein